MTSMNHHDNIEKEGIQLPTAEAADGRWGTLVIGEPVPRLAPQALYHHHPFSQQQQQQQPQDSSCVTGEAIKSSSSSSSPATVNSNYMEYPAHPFTMGTHLNPYVGISPAPGSAGKTRADTILNSLNQWGKKFEHATKKAESLAENVWHHLKTSPSVTDAALARLTKGTKVFTEGGHEKSFQQIFGIIHGEKLLKTFACYLSTSSGPIIGTLYISTKRIAFCSDNPLCHNLAPGQKEWIYYKVIVQLDRFHSVNPSANRLNHSEKYIQIITRDEHEFWFMGFVTYEKALKNLTEASQRSRATC